MDALLGEHDITLQDTLVYLHIPKTGGTTLMVHLDPCWHPAARFDAWSTIPITHVPPTTLAQYKSFIGHFYYAQLESLGLAPFVGVTSLRDPLKRAISHYSFIRSPGYEKSYPKLKSEIERVRQMSLEEYIDSGPLYDDSCDLQTRMLGNCLPTSPRRSQDAQANAALLSSAQQHLAALECFALTERMQESLFMFAFVFGWRPLVNELHLNPAHERLDAAKVSPELSARLTADNALDMQVYEFATRLFDERFRYMTAQLLERYGGADEAHRSYPLSVEVMAELLERHYRARYIARHPMAPRQELVYHLAFGDAMEGGLNWSMPEDHALTGLVRWTGANRRSAVDLPNLGGGDLTLSLYAVRGRNDEPIDRTLAVSVNGQEVALKSETVFPGMLLTAHLPRALIGQEPFVRVDLYVKDTETAGQMQSDPKNAPGPGVAIESIELYQAFYSGRVHLSLHKELARRIESQRAYHELEKWARSLQAIALEQQTRLDRYKQIFAPLVRVPFLKQTKNRLGL